MAMDGSVRLCAGSSRSCCELQRLIVMDLCASGQVGDVGDLRCAGLQHVEPGQRSMWNVM